jgi:uncharacterized membrane protein
VQVVVVVGVVVGVVVVVVVVVVVARLATAEKKQRQDHCERRERMSHRRSVPKSDRDA